MTGSQEQPPIIVYGAPLICPVCYSQHMQELYGNDRHRRSLFSGEVQTCSKCHGTFQYRDPSWFQEYIWFPIRRFFLRRTIRKLYNQYLSLTFGDAGNALSEYMSPEIRLLKFQVNNLLDELAKIGPGSTERLK